MQSEFTSAVFNNNIERVKEIYREGGIKLDYCNNIYFRKAVNNGYKEMAEWIYSLSDKNIIRINGNELMGNMIREGEIEMVKWLYEEGGELEENHIIDGIESNSYEMVKWLLERVEMPDNISMTEAILNGNYPICRILYEKGVRIDIIDMNIAVINKKVEICKWLRKRGYNMGDIIERLVEEEYESYIEFLKCVDKEDIMFDMNIYTMELVKYIFYE